MVKHGDRTHEDWAGSASRLVEGSLLIDPRLIPEVPRDGRDLPDVALDALIEAVLLRLTRKAGAFQ